MMLFFSLIRSKLLQLKYIATLLVQRGFVYINGSVCTLPTFNVQGGDAIQIVYSYETFVYDSMAQQVFLQQFLQHVFYFLNSVHPRDTQAKRLAYEKTMHKQYLHELRTKYGHDVTTRFSLLGERTHLYKPVL